MNLKIQVRIKTITKDGLKSEYLEPTKIEQEDDGSFTIVIEND